MLGLLGLPSSLSTVLIAGAVSLGAGFVGGWQARDAFCDAAEARAALAASVAREATLAARIAAERAARGAADTAAANEAARAAELERKARDVLATIDAGECLSRADADRLRSLWDDGGAPRR